MWTSSLLALSLALASHTSASPIPETRAVSLKYAVVESQATLRKVNGLTPSSAFLRTKLIAQEEIQADIFEESYIAEIAFGTQNFLAILDTGSSDTWLAQTGYTCVNITNNATVSEADCGFASTFTPDSTFQQIPNENFNISYADLEYLNGYVGYEDVTLAGLVVKHQEVGVATLAGWEGDNVTSGLVGLAYPSITSAYAGTNASADVFNSSTSHLIYSPIINTIFFEQNLTDPVFSLSLSRDVNTLGFAGLLTIGGIPNPYDPAVNATGYFVETAILPLTFLDVAPTYVFYAIQVEGLVYGQYGPGSEEGATTYIVDSGTTLNYFPADDAKMYNALFQPPAQVGDDGYYYVLCNATAPSLGVTIAGEVFYHNPVDLIYDEGIGEGICVSGIQNGGVLAEANAIFILGDVFQKNVLSVFDVGNEMMAFSARPYYDVPS